jgi:hypothetical protein
LQVIDGDEVKAANLKQSHASGSNSCTLAACAHILLFAPTDRFVEISGANGSYWALGPKSGSWSIAGTGFDEMVATLLPVGS